MAESPKSSKNHSLIKTKISTFSNKKNKKTKTVGTNYSFNTNSNQNIESIREDIRVLCQTLHSNNEEYSTLKTEQVKIEEEIKRNKLCINEILRTSPTLTKLLINSIILGEEISNESILELSDKNINLLVDRYIISIQKSKNKEIIHKISVKDKEIKLLKKLTKTNSMTKLANSIVMNNGELTELNHQYEQLQQDYNDLSQQYQKIIQDKNDLLKKVRKIIKENDKMKQENLELQKKNIEYENLYNKQSMNKENKMQSTKIGKNNSTKELHYTEKVNNESNIKSSKRKEDIENLNKQINELSQLNTKYDSQINKLEKDYNSKVTKYNNLKNTFFKYQNEYKKETDRQKFKEEVKTRNNTKVKDRYDSIKKENHNLDKEIEVLRQKIADEQIKQIQLENKIGSLKEIYLDYQEKINNQQEITLNLENQIDEQKETIDKIELEIEKTNQIIKDIERSKENETTKQSTFFATGLDIKAKPRHVIEEIEEENLSSQPIKEMNNENKKSQETNHIISENEGNNENVDIEDIENKTHSNNEN